MDRKAFVIGYMKAYKSNKTLQDLVPQFGVSAQAIYQKPYSLRKQGVNLPTMQRSKLQYDVDTLNKLIASYK